MVRAEGTRAVPGRRTSRVRRGDRGPPRESALSDALVRQQPGRYLRRRLGELRQRGVPVERTALRFGHLSARPAVPRDRARRAAPVGVDRPCRQRLDPGVTSAELAERLRTLTVETLEALQRAHFPGWRIPRAFGGHA